jgi:hypothetical protein
MRKSKGSTVIQQTTINRAAKYFLTANQILKNETIDLLFEEQPAMINFFKYLDEGHPNEMNKEIILQITSIIFIALRWQKIKVKKIRLSSITKHLDKNAQMKSYFSNPTFEFDDEGFDAFWQDYKQKHIMGYALFAIRNQFRSEVTTERDAVFIFYTIKTISDIITESTN